MAKIKVYRKAQDDNSIHYFRGRNASVENAWRSVHDAIKQYFKANGITASDVEKVYVNDTSVYIKSISDKIKSGEYKIAAKQKMAARADGKGEGAGYDYELVPKR